MRRYLPFALVVLACASILYGPLLSNFFDPQEFLSFLNPLKAGESPGRYMVNSWSWMQEGRRIGFFRPLTSLTFMMEFPLWGGNPAGYRLMNVLFHICAAILTIPLARRMGIIRLWWFVPLVVFIHPGAMDAVWFIAARNDVLAVLAALFLLYGFQSMIGEPCLHYTYALVVFFALITGYALESGALFGKGSSRPRRIICGAVLVLLFPASLHRSVMLKSISDPRHAVFEEVRVRADTLAKLDSVTIIRGNLDIVEENETRNIELYMDYIRPENDVVFRFAPDPSRLRQGEAFIVWSGDSLLLGTAPMQVPEI